MNGEDTRRFSAAISNELSRVAGNFDGFFGKVAEGGSMRDRSGDVSRYGPLSGCGSDVNMQTRDCIQAVMNGKHMASLFEAANRLDSGIYGVCKMCGNPISESRLKELPYAALCIKCQEEEERRNNGRIRQEISAGLCGYKCEHA